jgi:hypothetical protein
MGKRGNENAQQSKEDWQAAERDGKNEPSGTFQRASEDELKRRTIRLASGQYTSQSPAPSASSTPSSFNPFASVGFSSTTPSSTANPFANVTLLQSPWPAAAVAAAPPSASQTGRLPELIQAFQKHIQEDCGRQNKMGADWSRSMQQYKEFHRVITLPAAVAPVAAAPVAAAPVAAPAFAQMSSPSLASAAAASVASPDTTTTTTTSSTPPPTEGVKADPNSMWNKFHETKAKCFCFKHGEWSTFTGLLSLEQQGNSKVLVIRDEAIGKLRLNVALPTDIQYHQEKNQKGVVQKTIQFLTKEKAEESLFMVRLKTAPQNLTPLYNAIEKLAAAN